MEQELRLILELFATSHANQQSYESCDLLQQAMDKYKAKESWRNYVALRNSLMMALIVHCHLRQGKADAAYTEAIMAWLHGLGFCGLPIAKAMQDADGQKGSH